MERDGKTTIELLMEVVAPLVGGTIVCLLLIRNTPLPFWACFAIGLPVGTVVAWLVILGLFVVLERLFEDR